MSDLVDGKLFVGRDAWLFVPHPDLLIWWEGEQLRIGKIDGSVTNAETGETLDIPVYLHPASMAWEQAAQLADPED